MKKKVAIITRHAVPNYGSFLQALATQQMIAEIGYEPTIIDYKRVDESTEALIKYYTHLNKGLLSRIYYNLFWRLSHHIIENKLQNTREKYLFLSQRVDGKTIGEVTKNFDVYLTGSDQVWNVVGSGKTKEIDSNYFWEKVQSEDKIISYAASFGDAELNTKDFDKCKNCLGKFNNISVRENSGINILANMGFNSTQVIDPTLVLDRKYWINLAKKIKKQKKEPYALLYNLHSNTNMNNKVLESLKETDLKIISITTTFRKTIGERVFCPSIEEFLWLFMNADRVYADSFHAIAFSIIFEKSFYIAMPKDYSTRLESILELFNMKNRVFCNDDFIDNDIDWIEINKILEKEKAKSLKWLNKVIEDNE